MEVVMEVEGRVPESWSCGVIKGGSSCSCCGLGACLVLYQF